MSDRTLRVTLQLAEPAHMFYPPHIDPLSAYYRPYSYASGLDFIADLLYAHPRYRHVQATVMFPPEYVSDEIEHRLQQAVATYCDGKVLRANRASAGGRWRSLVWLPIALVALFLVVAGTEVVSRPHFPAGTYIASGLWVAGWVLLWYPLDNLLINYWVERLDNRIYRRLAALDLHVVAEPALPAPPSV